MMTLPRLTVLSGPRYAGGRKIAELPRGLQFSWQDSVIPAEDPLDIRVPVGAASTLPDLRPGRVILMEWEDRWREWIVADRARSIGAGAVPFLQIRCQSAHHFLRACVIQRTVEGSTPETNLAAINLTPRQMIGTFVVPTMASVGLDILLTGLVTTAERRTVSMSAWSPMRLVDWLAGELESEWDLRPDDVAGKYRVDFGPELYATDPIQVWLEEARQLLDFESRDSGVDLHTVIMVRGGIPQGSDQPATVSNAVMIVDDVVGDLLTLTNPGSNQPVILEDGQEVGRSLLAADLSTAEIVATAAPGTVEVDDASAFAVGDLVQFIADAERTGISELDSPSGRALSGRVMGTYDMEGRGERQWRRGPTFAEGSGTMQEVLIGSHDAVSGSSVLISNLPPSFTIPSGSVIYSSWGVRTTTGGTTDGSGEVNLPLSAGVSHAASRCRIIIGPTLLDVAGVATDGIVHNGIRPRSSCNLAPLICDFDGINLTGGANYGKHMLSGLEPDSWLWPGDVLVIPSSNPAVVVMPAQVDGDGEVQVTTNNVQTPSAASDIEVLRPDGIDDGVADTVAWFLNTSGTAWQLTSDPFHVAYTPGSPVMTVVCGLGAHRAVPTDSPSTQTPLLELRRVSDNSLLADSTIPISLPTGARGASVVLRAFYVMAEDEEVYVRVRGSNTLAQLTVRSLLLLTGADAEVPETRTAHANALRNETQRLLTRHRYGVAEYRGSAVEFAQQWDLPTDWVGIRKGRRVRVSIPTYGLSESLRVERITYDSGRLHNPVLELESLPRRLTRSVASSSTPEMGFVDVVFPTVPADQPRQTLVVLPRPPVAGLPGGVDQVDTVDDPYLTDPEPPEELIPVGPILLF